MSSASDSTSWTVLRAASCGDVEARALFARSYAPPIRAYLSHRWRGRSHTRDLEDAIQDVFVECYKPGGVIARADPNRGDFRALLYGVVRNVARRHEERLAVAAHETPHESVHRDDLPHAAEARLRFELLRQRQDEGRPIRDIAAALGESDVAKTHNDHRRAGREFAGPAARRRDCTHRGERVDVECRRLGELLES